MPSFFIHQSQITDTFSKPNAKRSGLLGMLSLLSALCYCQSYLNITNVSLWGRTFYRYEYMLSTVILIPDSNPVKWAVRQSLHSLYTQLCKLPVSKAVHLLQGTAPRLTSKPPNEVLLSMDGLRDNGPASEKDYGWYFGCMWSIWVSLGYFHSTVSSTIITGEGWTTTTLPPTAQSLLVK